MITCLIRYEIDESKIVDFECYARTWFRLIEKYGGTHHGYFLPPRLSPDAPFSFAGLGRKGPSNIAIAMFSFPSIEAYDAYRLNVAADPECSAATAHQQESQCFSGYERTFLEPIER